MKTKKTIGEMSYGEFVKESVKFTAKTYAIFGVCYGIYYLIKNKPMRVKPVSEDNDEIITENIEDVEDYWYEGNQAVDIILF